MQNLLPYKWPEAPHSFPTVGSFQRLKLPWAEAGSEDQEVSLEVQLWVPYWGGEWRHLRGLHLGCLFLFLVHLTSAGDAQAGDAKWGNRPPVPRALLRGLFGCLLSTYSHLAVCTEASNRVSTWAPAVQTRFMAFCNFLEWSMVSESSL